MTSGISAVASEGDHACALSTPGQLRCWGSNVYGKIGDGTTNTFRPTPTDVLGLSSGVTALAAGQYHTCTLTSGGAVKCWGGGYFGALGGGTLLGLGVRHVPLDPEARLQLSARAAGLACSPAPSSRLSRVAVE